MDIAEVLRAEAAVDTVAVLRPAVAEVDSPEAVAAVPAAAVLPAAVAEDAK